jgi:AcrR family transcriptional regulator
VAELVRSRLPRGRRPAGSGLDRDEVARIQRGRLLFAMAEAVADAGYVGVSVADVIARAGVSRATFYEQFRDKQDCFLAAFDAASDLLVTALAHLVPPAPDPAAFGPLLRAYLDHLAAHESFARVFLIEVRAVGPAGWQRRAHSQQRFVDTVLHVHGATGDDARFEAEALVAAIGALVTSRLVEGDVDGLRALHGPLLRLAARLLG